MGPSDDANRASGSSTDRASSRDHSEPRSASASFASHRPDSSVLNVEASRSSINKGPGDNAYGRSSRRSQQSGSVSIVPPAQPVSISESSALARPQPASPNDVAGSENERRQRDRERGKRSLRTRSRRVSAAMKRLWRRLIVKITTRSRARSDNSR